MRIILVLSALLFLAGCETYSVAYQPSDTRAHVSVGIYSGYHHRSHVYDHYYRHRPVVINRYVHPRPVYIYKNKKRKHMDRRYDRRHERRNRYDRNDRRRDRDRRDRRQHN